VKVNERLKGYCPEGRDQRIEISAINHGHAHTRYFGTCSADVTREDIIRLFAHPIFGGRDLVLKDGRFSYVRHND
jgi:hypothetical protein